MALFPIVETSTASSLRWGYLVVLGWLLGQEGEVPGCSIIDTGFFPVDYAGGIAGTDGTASRIATDADVDAAVDVLEGDSA